jgi:uncharacterized protein involved in type VI secretion and phage assembly
VSGHRPGGEPAGLFGVYPAIVTDIVDPDSLGRVEVSLPWIGGEGGEGARAWATLLTPYADDEQGFQVLPAVGTQVVVACEAGNPRRPYILGSAWNGREAMPEAPDAANDLRLIQSRAKSRLVFDDGAAGAVVTLDTESGHTIVLDAAALEVRIRHSNGCSITLNAAGQVEILANSTVEVSAPALNVHAATSTFDGMINCTSLIASVGVVSPSYTPGAGNIW